jgi:hypothetical protein
MESYSPARINLGGRASTSGKLDSRKEELLRWVSRLVVGQHSQSHPVLQFEDPKYVQQNVQLKMRTPD